MFYTGAEDKAATLYGDLAVLHLQRQQPHLDSQPQHEMIDTPISMKPSRSPYLNDASPRQTRLNAVNDIGGSVGANTPASGGLSLYTTPSPAPSQVLGLV